MRRTSVSAGSAVRRLWCRPTAHRRILCVWFRAQWRMVTSPGGAGGQERTPTIARQLYRGVPLPVAERRACGVLMNDAPSRRRLYVR